MKNPNQKLNITLIAARLAPYRLTLLNRLSELEHVRLSALLSYGNWHFQSQSVGLEQAGFPYQVFGSYTIHFDSARADRTSLEITPSLWLHLLRTRYDLIIAFGWTRPDTLAALFIAKCRRTPVVLWDTSIPHPAGRLKRFLMPLLRRMFGAFDGYFVPSTQAAKYFVSMGARAQDMTLIPQVIDTAVFAREAAGERLRRAQSKAELGITTRDVILFVGQLTARKGLDILIQAFQQVCAQNDRVSLLLVGEGPLQAELQEMARTMDLASRIFFRGYVPRADLPRTYALSDVFVLPSWYDTFGVVILEAMACGLPIITTSSVGAAQDLVREGENGFVVEYGDVDGLAKALLQVIQDETRVMGWATLRAALLPDGIWIWLLRILKKRSENLYDWT